MSQKTKAFEAAVLESIRSLMRTMMTEEFHGNGLHMARALGVSQAMVSDVLSGKGNPGMKVLLGIACHTGMTLDAIVSGGAMARRIYLDSRPRHEAAS